MKDAHMAEATRMTRSPSRDVTLPFKRARAISLAAVLSVLALLPLPHGASQLGTAQADDREHVTIALNQSRVIKLRSAAARVSVANPEIADILVLEPTQIYVVGKQLGTTNMVLWDANDRPIGRGMLLEVTPDLDLLKKRLHEVMPGERVEVRSAQGTVVVSGTVSSTEKAAAAAQIAQSFAGTAGGGVGQILNMIQVGGSQQVMLEVKVAEISRTLVNRLDINFTAFNDGGTFKIGTAGAGTTSPAGSDWSTYIPPFTSEGRAIFMNSLRGGFLFNAVIDAAKENGLAKILAEPNLTTLSGQEAKFLAGGEFPIPVPQDDGGITIEYKEYGVGLNFVPYVLDSGVISLKVNVSVSEPADQSTFVVGGIAQTAYTLNKRSANSTVEVRTGETIAIAGLINETLRENVSRFPGLGDLALLGTLFRSQDFVKGQTELVIFVTPRLANSFDPQLVRLPTDSFVEPNDREFYLMGRLDACRNRKDQSLFACGGALGPDVSGSEGHFGHDL